MTFDLTRRITLAIGGKIDPSLVRARKTGVAQLDDMLREVNIYNLHIRKLYAQRRTLEKEDKEARKAVTSEINSLAEIRSLKQFRAADLTAQLRPTIEQYDKVKELFKDAAQQATMLDQWTAKRREEQAKQAAKEEANQQRQIERNNKKFTARMIKRANWLANEEQDRLKRGLSLLRDNINKQEQLKLDAARMEQEQRDKSIAGLKRAATGFVIMGATLGAVGAAVISLTDKFNRLEAVARNTGTTINALRATSHTASLGLDLVGVDADNAADAVARFGEMVQKAFTTGEVKLNYRQLYFAGIRNPYAMFGKQGTELVSEIRGQLRQLSGNELQSALMHLDEAVGADMAELVAEAVGKSNTEWAEAVRVGSEANRIQEKQQMRLKETREAWARLTETGEIYADSVRASVAPAITAVLKGATGVIQTFGVFGTAVVGATTVLGGLSVGAFQVVSGLSDVTIGAFGLIKAVQLLLPVLATARVAFISTWAAALGPLGLIAVGIVAVGTAAFILYKNWDKVAAAGKRLWEGLKNALIPVATALKNILYWTVKLLTPLGLVFGVMNRLNIPTPRIPNTRSGNTTNQNSQTVNVYNDNWSFNGSDVTADDALSAQQNSYNRYVAARPSITGA